MSSPRFSDQTRQSPGDPTLKPRLICLLIFTAIVAGLFAPYFFSRDPVVLSLKNEDIDHQYLAWRAFGFAELAAGRIPYWNPFSYGGQPYFAGFQAALLYPVNWLHFVLPTHVAINAEIALNVWIAGVCMFFWASGLGLEAVAATVAALSFAFAGPVIACVMPGHLSNLATIAWMPLVLLAIDKIFQDGWSRKWLAIGAVAYTLHLLGGHPQYAFYFGLIASLYGALRWFESPAKSWQDLTAAAAVPAIGLCIAALQLIPGAFLLKETLRGSANYNFASSYSFDPANLWLLVFPRKLGGLGESVYHGINNYWEETPFFGLVALGLAVVSLRNGRRTWSMAAAAVLALFLALGVELPALYEWLYQHLPLFSSFRGTSKFICIFALFGAQMAAQGFAALTRANGTLRSAPSRQATVIFGCVVLILLFAWLYGPTDLAVRGRTLRAPIGNHSGSFVHPFVFEETPLFEIGVALLALSTLGLARKWRGAAAALAVLIAVEGTRFASSQIVAHELPKDLAAAEMQTTAENEPSLGAPRSSEPGNAGMLKRRPSLLGSDPFALRRYMELIAVTQGGDAESIDQEFELHQTAHPLSQLLRSADAKQVLPEIFFVPRYEIRAPGADVLAALSEPEFDPHEVAILERPPAIPFMPKADDAVEPKVEITRRTPSRIDFSVENAAASLLVTSVNYAAGWSAVTPDGRELEVFPVDHAFVGVAVPAGTAQVRLEYRAPGVALGAGVSGAACLGLLTFCGLRRRERSSALSRVRAVKFRGKSNLIFGIAAGAAGVAAVIFGFAPSQRLPLPVDDALGWRQPFRDQGSIHPFELETPPAESIRGKFVALGNQMLRAPELDSPQTFAARLRLFNAGIAEYRTYQQIEVYNRYLGGSGARGVVLFVTPADFASREEALALQEHPLESLMSKTPNPRWDSYLGRMNEVTSRANLDSQVWSDWTTAVLAFKQSLSRPLLIVFLPTDRYLRATRAKAANLGAELTTWSKEHGLRAFDLTATLSANPEVFFARVAEQQLARPLKIRRILTAEGHAEIAAALAPFLSGSDATPEAKSVPGPIARRN